MDGGKRRMDGIEEGVYECSSVEEKMHGWRVKHRGGSARLERIGGVHGWGSIEEGEYGR